MKIKTLSTGWQRQSRLVFTFAFFAAIILTTFAVHVNAQTTPRPCFDFTGTGRTSFTTLSGGAAGTNIIWRILSNGGGGGATIVPYGLNGSETNPGDVPTPGYFDADNRADLGVWRVPNATFYIRQSTVTNPNTLRIQQFGLSTDIPGRDADYDGDGRDDLTVVRRVNGVWNWFFLRSNTNTLGIIAFGIGNNTASEDFPIAGANYAGDARAEVTVLRFAAGTDTYLAGDSNTGALVLAQPWGDFDTDFYVVGDYLGDARADFAIARAFGTGTNMLWAIRENGGSNATVIREFGLTTPNTSPTIIDNAICGDYNGDGKSDIAVYRYSNSTFYWLNSPGFTAFNGQPWGQANTDFPVAALRAY